MTEDDAKNFGKFVLAVAKVVSSTLIDIELAKQETLARSENRLGDWLLIRLGQSIKPHVDFALDNWIISL
jgi:hypothetical protein